MTHPVFCFNLVGLSPALLDKLVQMPTFSRLLEKGKKTTITPAFPCLTLPGQATLSTGTYPAQHGIIANGFYDRDRFEVSFWDQYRSLVQATPIWETLKNSNSKAKTAVLFCQNTLYGHADFIITPKPLHTDDGLVQWCYSKPVGLYEAAREKIGRPFNLMDYWGPMASSKASEWIMESAIYILKEHMPDFMMTYIPHLDYSCQKYGPEDPRVEPDLAVIDQLVAKFVHTLEQIGILDQSSFCFFSEYSITPVNGAVFLNQALRKKGFLMVREIEGREYLDFEMSRAFAMVDHQVAHIYVRQAADIAPVKQMVEQMDGVDTVLTRDQQAGCKIDHDRSGELVAVSDRDKWFAYYWWQDPEKAPDFAGNIDIHRKPGYDPLELFIDMKTMKIPQTTELVKGSHGAPARDGQGMAVFMASGKTAEKLDLPETMDMVDIHPLFKQMVQAVDV